MSGSEVIRHEVKILPEFFRSIIEGDKTFEIRYDGDRGYQKGDLVNMREHDRGTYSGRRAVVRIKYVSSYGQKDNWVVFGFNIEEIKS